MPQEHPFVFHLVQARVWDQNIESDATYYPSTYEVDGFTPGTSNPQRLLSVANHFYLDVKGQVYCLRMTVESLKASGVETTFEGAANQQGISTRISMGAYHELFPRIQGGLKASAVLEAHTVNRRRPDGGTFLSIEGITR
jgi:uncharacterized protein (DUF952 family)